MNIPDLKPDEYERLALIMEEAAEVQQVIGKILRHGYESTHPDGGPTNRQLLNREIGDLQAAIQLGYDNADLEERTVAYHKSEKLRNVFRYLHYNKP